jgi:hypothetical protein
VVSPFQGRDGPGRAGRHSAPDRLAGDAIGIFGEDARIERHGPRQVRDLVAGLAVERALGGLVPDLGDERLQFQFLSSVVAVLLLTGWNMDPLLPQTTANAAVPHCADRMAPSNMP